VPKVAERVQQPVAKRGIDGRRVDLAHGVDRAAELLQIVLTAFAFQQVLVEPRARLTVQ